MPSDEEPPPHRPSRVLIWLGAMALLAGALWRLSRLYPGAIDDDPASVARAVALVVLVSAAILAPGRIDWGEKARHVLLWAAVVGVLVLGFALRAELANLPARLRGEFASGYPADSGAGELVVSQRDDGHFHVMGRVNGRPVLFLVDTGATETVLSPDDARRLGLDTAAMTFDQAAETANGQGYSARYIADELAVGPVRLAAFPMAINQAPMRRSLLGMSFLRQLESFQVRGDKLYLRYRSRP